MSIPTPCLPRKKCVICESRLFSKSASPEKKAAKFAHMAQEHGAAAIRAIKESGAAMDESMKAGMAVRRAKQVPKPDQRQIATLMTAAVNHVARAVDLDNAAYLWAREAAAYATRALDLAPSYADKSVAA